MGIPVYPLSQQDRPDLESDMNLEISTINPVRNTIEMLETRLKHLNHEEEDMVRAQAAVTKRLSLIRAAQPAVRTALQELRRAEKAAHE
jgi:hypothetical protein